MSVPVDGPALELPGLLSGPPREPSLAAAGTGAVSPLARRIRDGDRRALARGLSAVENRLPGAEDLLRELHAPARSVLRVGITGPPGAGKSTLADCIVERLRSEGSAVAILAVDPSSPFTGGAILGDRVRMQRHHSDPGVFIRSMASRGELGGLAPSVAEALTLLDAAGFDAVLIETAGVGQSEVDVVQLAGTVAVVLTPTLGDDVQVAKAGIMEIADVFVINKADLPGADELERQILAAISLIPPGRPAPPVLRTAAHRGEGIGDLVGALRESRGSRTGHAYWKRRLLERVSSEVRAMLASESALGAELDSAAGAVAAGTLNPYSFVSDFVRRLRRQWNP